ncbi:drug resistance transporter, EmrB/QacA subfamily [Pedobacter westerhofensis]|uniref:Drug resistance transporter, EmrB/QacA subfamily n=1 Tax=Pedobacter westerhofensis TaxID=425512 RepID=A0A521DTP7_9SPHI|nr:MFS transporter [Pedobacter westerhofensis]SMO75077.1 drug resistance transporter, EmrB/QacA subfamily [Pedobacter westerhofensis]
MPATLIYRKTALAVILTVQLMLAMDFLIVIVSLKNIQIDLGFTAADLSWIPNAFALAFGGLLLLGGRLGDMIGQVKAFKIGLAIFVLASLAGGIAPSPSVLIIARVFQGVGSALAAPSVLALITILARNEEEKNHGLSLFNAISSIGASVGLILGGALTAFISWRWSLLINVPVGAVTFAAIGFLVPETSKVKGKIDFSGALTAIFGSTALVYGFISAAENSWLSLLTIGSFIAAVLLFTLFFLIESKVADPLLRLSILCPKPRQGGLIVMAAVVGMHFASLFLILQYFQQVLGLNPLLAGFAYMPLTITVFSVTQFVPRMVIRFGVRNLMVVGCILVAAGVIGFSRLNANSTYWGDVLFPVILHSVGVALVFTPGSIIVLEGVEDQDAGIASGVLQISQQIGGAIGIAAMVSIYTANLKPHDFSSGLSSAFLAAAGISVLAAIITIIYVPHKPETNK